MRESVTIKLSARDMKQTKARVEAALVVGFQVELKATGDWYQVGGDRCETFAPGEVRFHRKARKWPVELKNEETGKWIKVRPCAGGYHEPSLWLTCVSVASNCVQQLSSRVGSDALAC